MTRDNPDADGAQSGSQALLVFLIVLLGGVTLNVGADETHHLGPALGNLCFDALPLIATLAAAHRLHHH